MSVHFIQTKYFQTPLCNYLLKTPQDAIKCTVKTKCDYLQTPHLIKIADNILNITTIVLCQQ